MTDFHLRFTRRGLGAIAASAIALLSFAAPALTYAADKVIKVGIMSGEDEDVRRAVTAEAAKKGLKI